MDVRKRRQLVGKDMEFVFWDCWGCMHLHPNIGPLYTSKLSTIGGGYFVLFLLIIDKNRNKSPRTEITGGIEKQHPTDPNTLRTKECKA